MKKKNFDLFYKVLLTNKSWKIRHVLKKFSFIDQIMSGVIFYLYLAMFKCIQYIKKVNHVELLFRELRCLKNHKIVYWKCTETV